MENEFIGAIKIKDGLFIGDEFAAQDLEFIITNKVTHIINCAGKQLANYWESLGVIYLTYNWLDVQNQVVFDPKGDTVNEIYNFIEEAHSNGDSVLVHSERGQSRSCCIIAAYFMKRFRWTLYKTLEFLASRRPDLEIRDSFYYQLVNLESKLAQETKGNVSGNWHEVHPEMDHEELLLRNTFLNARNAPLDEHLINPQIDLEDKKMTINWGDEKLNDVNKLAQHLNEEHIIKIRQLTPQKSFVKSILKGSNKVFKFGGKKVEDDPLQNLKKQIAPTGMRQNKSMKMLHEDRTSSSSNNSGLVNPNNNSYSSSIKKGVVPTGGTRVIDLNEKSVPLKPSQGGNLPRSSSASNFEKEKNDTLQQDSANSLLSTNPSISSQKGMSSSSVLSSGGLMNLTNERGVPPRPSSSLSLTAGSSQNNHPSGTSSHYPVGSLQLNSVKNSHSENPSTQNINRVKLHDISEKFSEKRSEMKSPTVLTDISKGIMNVNSSSESNEPFSKILSDPNADKNSLNYLAAKQLKLAIQKKLSKDIKSQDTTVAPNSEDANTYFGDSYINNINNNGTVVTDPRNRTAPLTKSINKPPRNERDLNDFKKPARPTDIKVNYHVLLKNRETPPPRQREEAKKNPESVYKKALANSSFSHSRSKENSISNNSSAAYLQNLFPSALIQLNSYTPSAPSNPMSNVDKKLPASTKATSSQQYNFNTASTSKMLSGSNDRAATPTSMLNQPFEKNYSSSNSFLDAYLKPSTTPVGHQSNQPYSFKPPQVNNFMSQTKGHPVKVTYEKAGDRPRSTAQPVRAATPNASISQTHKGNLMLDSRFDRKGVVNSSGTLRSNLSANSSKTNFNPTLRSFSPSLQPAPAVAHVRRESPSAQAGARYRQRSSSPSQNMSYSNIFSNGPNSKPKWKF